jgi:RNA polymerase sigma-70 factor (ECF subfamily)
MVMLRVVAGLDVAVVAAIVGKSPGAVRVSVHRGLKALSRDPNVRAEVS